LSGRPKGQELRSRLKLKNEDESPAEVAVIIPDSILTLNSSFFLGLFGESVRKLGEQRFKSKYKFSTNHDRVKRDIERGIMYAQETSNPLG
jgi:hypothetical protein